MWRVAEIKVCWWPVKAKIKALIRSFINNNLRIDLLDNSHKLKNMDIRLKELKKLILKTTKKSKYKNKIIWNSLVLVISTSHSSKRHRRWVTSSNTRPKTSTKTLPPSNSPDTTAPPRTSWTPSTRTCKSLNKNTKKDKQNTNSTNRQRGEWQPRALSQAKRICSGSRIVSISTEELQMKM